MKKRVLSIILCLAIVFSICPMTAFAVPSGGFTVDGQNYDSSEILNDQGGLGWNWDASEKTLTLDGYCSGSIAMDVEGAKINIKSDSHINSNTLGAATITLSKKTTIVGVNAQLEVGQSSSSDSAILCDNCNVTFSGNLDLTISSSGFGIKAINGDVTFNQKGEININAENNCIVASGNVTLDQNGPFNATSSLPGKAVIAVTGESKKLIITNSIESCTFTGNNVAAVIPADTQKDTEVKIKGTAQDGHYISFERVLLNVNGHEYSVSDMVNDFSVDNEGFSWDASEKTLTLAGYNGGTISSSYDGITICAAAGTDNTITGTESGFGLEVFKKTTLAGDGNLTISNQAANVDCGAMHVSDSNVYFNNNGTLKLNSNAKALFINDSNIYFLGAGTVDIYGSDQGISFIASAAKSLVFDAAGDISITSDNNAIETSENTIIEMRSKGKVTVESFSTAGNITASAVRLWNNAKIKIMNAGNGPFIFKTSGNDSVRVIAKDGGTPIIDVSASYTVTGSPTEQTVIYDKTNLVVGGHEYSGLEIESDIAIPEEGWSWNAALRQLTLNNYNGDRLYFGRNAEVILADGTTNTITNTNASNPGIHGRADVVSILGGGDLNIISEGSGIESCEIILSGSGALNVTANKEAIFVTWGNVSLNGSGEVSLTSTGWDTVGFYHIDKTLLLNGTSTPITLKSATGRRVINTSGSAPIVGGSALSAYTVEGSPDSDYVKYVRIAEPVPENNSNADVVSTGDGSNYWIWIILICVCIVLICGGIVYKRKNK